MTAASEKKLIILSIEDDPDIASLIRLLIGRAPAELLSAHHPTEAREILADLTPDLILLDLMLPEINGLDFLEVAGRKTYPRAILCERLQFEDSRPSLRPLYADHLASLDVQQCERPVSRKPSDLNIDLIEALTEHRFHWVAKDGRNVSNHRTHDISLCRLNGMRQWRAGYRLNRRRRMIVQVDCS